MRKVQRVDEGKELYIIYNFKDKVMSKLQVSRYRQFYKYEDKDNNIIIYRREEM